MIAKGRAKTLSFIALFPNTFPGFTTCTLTGTFSIPINLFTGIRTIENKCAIVVRLTPLEYLLFPFKVNQCKRLNRITNKKGPE